jgi:Holliday junction DNA helicase RuvB
MISDFAQVNKTDLTLESVDGALKLLGVDEKGLTSADREILETIIGKFGGGPVGLNTIASSLSEEEATIEEFNEPYLIQIGFIDRTPRGRVATEHAYRHLGMTPPTLL